MSREHEPLPRERWNAWYDLKLPWVRARMVDANGDFVLECIIRYPVTLWVIRLPVYKPISAYDLASSTPDAAPLEVREFAFNHKEVDTATIDISRSVIYVFKERKSNGTTNSVRQSETVDNCPDASGPSDAGVDG